LLFIELFTPEHWCSKMDESAPQYVRRGIAIVKMLLKLRGKAPFLIMEGQMLHWT